MKLFAALTVAALSMCLFAPAHAQTEDNLKGATEIAVAISVDKSLKDAGLNEDAIQISAELKLRSTGLRVLADSGPGSMPKNPHFIVLGIEIHGLKLDKLPVYCYVISYTITGDAQQIRPPHQVFHPTIWQNVTLNYVDESRIFLIKESSDNLCDKLANDYLKANPKPSPVAP